MPRLRATRLSAISQAVRQQGAFSPPLLFSSGEQGFWYDPSDMSTLFQDAAGTTPVTAVGQPVGLMLDKSIPPGTELVVNGGVRLNIDGWSVAPAFSGTSSVTWDGALRLVCTGGSYGEVVSSKLQLVIGRRYTFEMEVLEGTSANYWIILANSGTSDNPGRLALASESTGTSPAGYKKWRYSFVATYADAWLYLAAKGPGSVFRARDISVRERSGSHATQTAPALRPLFRQTAEGLCYLETPAGSGAFLQTSAIDLTMTNQISLFVGIRKLTDTATAVAVESSTNSGTTAGAFALFAPNGTTPGFRFRARGTTSVDVDSLSIYPAPTTQVVTCLADISSATRIRVSGQEVVNSAGAGSGNFGNHPIYIGRRAGTSSSFAGQYFGMILRGAATDAALITQTESWVNAKTGAY